MRRIILAGVSTVAIALGGCSTIDDMFQSSSSDRSTASAQPAPPPAMAAAAPAASPADSVAAPSAATTTATRAEVRTAQQKLQAAGLYKGKIDGIAGPKTRHALAQYQKQQGLQQTGKLDRKTMAQLAGARTSGTGSTVPPAGAPAGAPTGAPAGAPANTSGHDGAPMGSTPQK